MVTTGGWVLHFIQKGFLAGLDFISGCKSSSSVFFLGRDGAPSSMSFVRFCTGMEMLVLSFPLTLLVSNAES